MAQIWPHMGENVHFPTAVAPKKIRPKWAGLAVCLVSKPFQLQENSGGFACQLRRLIQAELLQSGAAGPHSGSHPASWQPDWESGFVLGSLWGTLGSLWDYFGVNLGHFGVSLGLLWGHFGVTRVPLWCHFGRIDVELQV